MSDPREHAGAPEQNDQVPATQPNRFAAKVKQAEPPNEKTLKIKTNSLKRTVKDLAYAKKEVVQETERLEKMREENSDRTTQQENVLNEAKMMVPHSEGRIVAAIKDLADFLEKEGPNIQNEELIQAAKDALVEGQAVAPQ